MKFSVTSSLLLAASMTGMALAQGSSSSSVAASSSSSSAAAPSSSSASSSASSGGSGGSGGGAAGSTPTATCTLFSGDPKAKAFGCPANAITSTPPYDSASLQSYLIGAYTAGKEGTAYSEVASKLANSVTDAYPTLTISYSAIVQQYADALSQSAKTYDAAPSSFNVPRGLGTAGVLIAAAVMGGAFVL